MYWLFKGHTGPAKPVEKTFDNLVILIANHENPKRNPIAERLQFNMRNRKTGESVSNVCRKKDKYLLPTKHFSNVVSDREFRGWFISSILVAYLKCHATNYHKY